MGSEKLLFTVCSPYTLVSSIVITKAKRYARQKPASAPTTAYLVTDELSFPVPTMLKSKTQVDNNSLYNTPNCYSIYICGKVFKWIKNTGGLEAMKQRNIEKANVLYDYLDSQDFYIAPAQKDSRSIMNVTFKTKSPELDDLFVSKAKENNIVNIKGHRSVGGMRASIYNAMPKEGVVALVEFMKQFAKENS